MDIDNFNRKILLVAKDKREADWISHLFSTAGGAALEVETSTSNVVPRLGDDSLEACMVTSMVLADSFGSDVMGCESLSSAMAKDPKANKKPLIILDNTAGENLSLYRAGAHLVVSGNLDKTAAHGCLLQLESILSLLDNYKSTERKFAFRV